MHQFDLVTRIHIAERTAEADREFGNDLLQVRDDVMINGINGNFRDRRKQRQDDDIRIIVDEGSDFMRGSIPFLRDTVFRRLDSGNDMILLPAIEIQEQWRKQMHQGASQFHDMQREIIVDEDDRNDRIHDRRNDIQGACNVVLLIGCQ